MNINKFDDAAEDVRRARKVLERVKSGETRRLFPLRINATTVIMVTEDKNNEAYAEEYRRRIDGKCY